LEEYCKEKKMLRGLNYAIRFHPRVLPKNTASVCRYFTTNNSGGSDHSNFRGAQQNRTNIDHSNFKGVNPQGVPAAQVNLDVDPDVLAKDAAIKHSQAAKSGDIVTEIQARVEQSIADRMKNHLSAPQQANQERELNPEEIAYALKMDAAQKQSIGDKLGDPILLEEARLEQSVADSISPNQSLYGQGPGTHQGRQRNQSQRPQQQSQQQRPPQQQQIRDQELFDLKMDAAQKQSFADRTGDQALMSEARIEQSLADSRSPNPRGQPLYGNGPSGQVRNTQQEQDTEEFNGNIILDEDDIFEEAVTTIFEEYPTDQEVSGLNNNQSDLNKPTDVGL